MYRDYRIGHYESGECGEWKNNGEIKLRRFGAGLKGLKGLKGLSLRGERYPDDG